MQECFDASTLCPLNKIAQLLFSNECISKGLTWIKLSEMIMWWLGTKKETITIPTDDGEMFACFGKLMLVICHGTQWFRWQPYLIHSAEYMGVILLETSYSCQTRKRTRDLIPVKNTKVSHTQRQLLDGTRPMVEHHTENIKRWELMQSCSKPSTWSLDAVKLRLKAL